MKKLLFIIVNYNSYQVMYDYLLSIEKNAQLVKDSCEIFVHICDNSTIRENIDIDSLKNVNITIYNLDNLGYLNGAFYALNKVDNKSLYDFIIISNVDLILEDNFALSLLEKENYQNNIGQIAPHIQSILLGSNLNPFLKDRMTKRHLLFLQKLYKYPFLYSLYYKLYKIKENLFSSKQTELPMMSKIYSAHGSLMIFSSKFFELENEWNYPIFLYGEELWFSEILLQNNLDVVYNPKIKLKSIDSVSLGKVSYKKLCKFKFESINLILSNFYK